MVKVEVFKIACNFACQTSLVSSKGPVYLRLQLKGKRGIVFKHCCAKGTENLKNSCILSSRAVEK